MVGVVYIFNLCSCLGAGCWSMGGDEYFFQQWNRVRVQGVGRREGLRRGRFKGMFGCGRGGGCKVFHEVASYYLVEKVVGIRVVDKSLSQFGNVIVKQCPIRRDFIGAMYECTNVRVFIALRAFTGIV